MNAWTYALYIAALLGAGLIGGLFFAFSSFVMKALSEIAPAEGIHANPAFLGVFLGTAAVSMIVAILTLSGGAPHWLLWGALLYVFGTFLVTLLGNVPLNNQLAAVSAHDPNGQDLWQHYLKRWTFFNHVRTAASMVAAFCFTIGLIQS